MEFLSGSDVIANNKNTLMVCDEINKDLRIEVATLKRTIDDFRKDLPCHTSAITTRAQSAQILAAELSIFVEMCTYVAAYSCSTTVQRIVHYYYYYAQASNTEYNVHVYPR